MITSGAKTVTAYDMLWRYWLLDNLPVCRVTDVTDLYVLAREYGVYAPHGIHDWFNICCNCQGPAEKDGVTVVFERNAANTMFEGRWRRLCTPCFDATRAIIELGR